MAEQPADERAVQLQLQKKCYLRVNGFDLNTNTVSYSVLHLAQSSASTSFTLLWRDAGSTTENKVPGVVLDSYSGWVFVRFSFSVQCQQSQRAVEYAVTEGSAAADYHAKFTVPGAGQPWRWGFYSCNGFHDPAEEAKAGGIQALWRDVMECHGKRPFHCMIGGGDQLYNDDVWKVPSLVGWTQLPDAPTRMAAPYSGDMEKQVADYYFAHYLKHWAEPVFSDALGAIPQIMMWDDHDIFDGWGSYPEDLQACTVFQGVYKAANRFFALFQQHTTPERAHTDNQVFGSPRAWHTMCLLGPSLAAVVMDSRSERTRTQIISQAAWTELEGRLKALPASVRHVVFVATVPVVYPKIPIVESAAQYLSDTGSSAVAAMLQKSGLATQLYSQFGTVEILDDLLDHWGADVHEGEKKAMVRMFQDIAKARNMRFTFLSGDVHLAAAGHLYSALGHQPRDDHRHMVQVISSAIGNTPPPPGVVNALKQFAAPKHLTLRTKETMDPVFGPGECLKAARNWCAVEVKPHEEGSVAQDGGLVFSLRCEHEGLATKGPLVYNIDVPLLDCHADNSSEADAPDAPTSGLRKFFCCGA